MEKGLEEILESFKNLKVAVVGDVMLDVYKWGLVERISPEAAAPVVNVHDRSQNLGGAGNVAANVSSLGANCELYGVVGDDRNGEEIKKLCSEKGIETFLVFGKNPTISKERIMGEAPSKRGYFQQIARVDEGESASRNITSQNREEFFSAFSEGLGDVDALILSDYNKGFFDKELSLRIIKLARERDIKIFVDPKADNIDYFLEATLISPNRSEAEKITSIKIIENGRALSLDQLRGASKFLREVYEFDLCTITCDSEGVFYDSGGSDYGMVEAGTKKGKEVSGAGDTFIASLALAYTFGKDLRESVEFANLVSGIAVEQYGVVAPTAQEVLERYRES